MHALFRNGCAVLGLWCATTALADTKEVRLVKTPDGGIQPQAVVDSHGAVDLLYFKGNADSGDLFYVRLDSAPTSSAEPLRVNNPPGTGGALRTIARRQLAL